MHDISAAVFPYLPEAAGYRSDRMETVDQFFQKLIDRQQIQCAVYALSRNGRIFAERGMGRLHYTEGDDRPCTYDAIRRIASITKLFAATAIMKLVEDGYFEPGQSVGDLLKEFDNATHRSIQVAHLLSHTSGLCPDGGTFFNPYELDWYELCAAKDAKLNWVEAMLTVPLRNKPGVEWAYSSSGYALLGEIVTRVTGVRCETWIEDNILRPLGMTDSGFTVPKEKWDRMIATEEWSNPYLRDKREKEYEEELEQTGKKRVDIPRTGGGLYSTVHDLAIFGEMLLNKGTRGDVTILSRKTVELMTKDFTGGVPNYCWGAGGSAKHYGLGPDLYGRNRFGLNSTETFGHEGAGRSSLYIDPAENFVSVTFVPTTRDWEPETINNVANVIWSGLL